MDISVEALCNLLAKHKLLDAAEVRALRQRWLGEAKTDAADTGKFGKWLAANSPLTDFQLGLLARGTVEQLFFDQYLLQDRIGQGRMAGVYRAVHPTGQQVAIKVLPPSRAANSQLLARFQREARMAIPINHPQVVRTFQQGITKAGLNYIVMELLDGETLEDVLKWRKTVTPVEVVHVGVQALEGLQHLFEEGLVHRDLKPGNLMLVPDWEGEKPDTILSSRVKILDIGLGRVLFDEAGGMPDNVDLTAEGSILGTPSYMAPEQARNARTADIRSDIYSLGCVLYEALAGKPPFEEANFMRQILRHATEPPRPLRETRPDLPEGLWQVIETMLAKDPAQRYSTPRQAAKALKASLPAPVELPKPVDPTPKMQSYLKWLAANGATAGADAPAAAPIPVPPPPPAKAAAPPAAPAPKPAVPPPSPKAPAPIPPAAVKALPDATTTLPPENLALIPAPAPGKTPLPPNRAAIPTAQPATPAVVPLPKNSPPTDKHPVLPAPVGILAEPKPSGALLTLFEGKLVITARDLICAAAGAGLLLVLEGFLWLLARLFGG